MDKIRINFVLPPSPKITGGPLAILEYANRFIDRGYDVSITTLPDIYWGQSPFPWFDFKGKIYYTKIKNRWKQKIKNKLFDPITNDSNIFANEYKNAKYLMEAIPDCDLNIGTLWSTMFPVYFSRKGKPIYFMQHFEEVFYSNELIQMPNKLGVRMSYSLPVYKVANSSWLQKVILDKYGQRVPYSNNAIVLEDFIPMKKKSEEDSRIRVVTYSRPEEWKGFGDAIAAMGIIMDKYTNVEWHVFGYENPLLPPNNQWAPYTFHKALSFKQLGELYASSDIVFCPSWYESFPLPPLEGMASGTAVISTRYGTEDYAFDKQNSLVVGSRDIDGMIECLEQLITNKDLRNKLAANGRETANKYNWENAVNDREKILLDIHNNQSTYDIFKSSKLGLYDYNNIEFEQSPLNISMPDHSLISHQGMVFIIENNMKRHIFDSKVFSDLQLRSKDIREVDNLTFFRIPLGSPIYSKADITK